MAFYPSTGFAPSFAGGYPGGGYPGATFYGAPATFSSGAQVAQVASDAASQHGEDHASQAPLSVSGFQQQQPWGYGAYPAAIPTATVLPTTILPLAAPTIRRPGYNERLIAWRNRQKVKAKGR